MYTKRDLKVEFPEALNKLPKRRGGSRIDRLNEIFNVTEQKWELNLQRLITNEAKVKYVLIGEAAPYSNEGEVQYFYNEKLESNWRSRVYKAFFGDSTTLSTPELRLQALAQKGFLLIDVLPFAENYKSKQRAKEPYKDMIRLCANDYFFRKITDPRLKWDSDIQIAFGVPNTCRAVKEVFNGTIQFPNGQVISIDEKQTCTNPSNTPDSSILRKIFGL